MKTLHAHILQIMSVQSEGYLIDPAAAAFMAAGIDDAEEVLKALKSMEGKEVEYMVVETDFERPVPVFSDDGEVTGTETEKLTIVTDEGWQLTDKGKKAVSA